MNNYDSIDKLLEFGLSLSVAQQMVNTMNYSIQNMIIPGTEKQIKANRPIQYFAVIEQVQTGPFSEKELCNLIKNYKLTKESLIWTQGMNGWMKTCDIPQINKLFMLYPPQIPEK